MLSHRLPQPIKTDLDKKSLLKQKTFQNFNIDAQGFRKTRNENPAMQEIEITIKPVPADLTMTGRSASTG